jgi:isopentenyl-diphosphate delta-isomerase
MNHHDIPLIKVLDKNGNDIGKPMSMREVHANPDLLCETVHVWVYDANGWILLQQRSLDNYLNPGRWDVSAAGHTDYGEEIEETAVRETKEEIGLDIAKKDLELIKKMYKETLYPFGDLFHNQFVSIYLVGADKTIVKTKLEDGEVEALKWMKIEDFIKEVHDNELSKKYVPHGDKYYNLIISEIKERVDL